MNDKLTVKVTVPMKGEEVILSNDIIFSGKDGMYTLKAGKNTIPMPMWEKMTVERSNKESDNG